MAQSAEQKAEQEAAVAKLAELMIRRILNTIYRQDGTALPRAEAERIIREPGFREHE